LAAFVQTAIRDYGLGVSFVTAGLIPQNERLGSRFLQALSCLGPYASDLAVTVSFNFENLAARKDLNDYICRVRDTFELLRCVGLRSARINLLFDMSKDNSAYSREINELRSSLYYFIQGGRMENSLVTEVGDAAANYAPALSNEEIERANRVCCPILKMASPSFTIRSDGRVALFCMVSGSRGATVGNVYENDKGQIKMASYQFIGSFERLRRSETKPRMRCEFHRTMNWRADPPKSQNPLVRRFA
jgi:hypothetical protein